MQRGRPGKHRAPSSGPALPALLVSVTGAALTALAVLPAEAIEASATGSVAREVVVPASSERQLASITGGAREQRARAARTRALREATPSPGQAFTRPAAVVPTPTLREPNADPAKAAAFAAAARAAAEKAAAEKAAAEKAAAEKAAVEKAAADKAAAEKAAAQTAARAAKAEAAKAAKAKAAQEPARSKPAPPEPAAPGSSGLKRCPVPSASFTDSWGAARSGGRRHKGTDMLASYGAPVYAIAAGRVSTASSRNGGLSLYLRADDGTRYFYAHNSANLVRDGQRVSAGQLIAKVGTSGNARGGPPHVHFERQPGGGAAVNPYRMLKGLCG